MRKLLLSVILAASFTGVFAQKLEDVQEKISKGKYDEAKEKIDKVLEDPKNQTNASAWYYKGKVYAELARLDTTGSLTYDAQKQAFDAFKKYQELDPKNVLMTLDQNVGLFQLYDMYYNQGVKNYNKKDYTTAFDKMKNGLEVGSYISKKGYSYNGFAVPALDTQLVNLAATSAYLAKKEDEAIPYFEQLANAKIKENKEIYGLLAEYYTKKGDQQKADKYIALGSELFPDPEYWTSIEFGNPGDDKPKRFARYEALLQKHPDSYPLAMDYAIELFNYTFANEKKPADYVERMDKTSKALEKALSLKSTAIGNFVMSQHIYNQIYDLDDTLRTINGKTPADVNKRKNITAKENAKYEELYSYSTKAYDLYTHEPTLKAQDKANLRKVINQLIDYHQRKKQADKVAFYQEKLKTL